jgi:hypothetical protein
MVYLHEELLFAFYKKHFVFLLSVKTILGFCFLKKPIYGILDREVRTQIQTSSK